MIVNGESICRRVVRLIIKGFGTEFRLLTFDFLIRTFVASGFRPPHQRANTGHNSLLKVRSQSRNLAQLLLRHSASLSSATQSEP